MALAVESQPPAPALDQPSQSFSAYRPHGNFETEKLPSTSDLEKCEKMPVFNTLGESCVFKDLYQGNRTMVIFVRHFFCGMCQDFLSRLSEEVSKESLKAARNPTSIIIIGCGQPELIKDYALRTRCPFPIYADPSRKLYDLFGMTSTLSQGGRRPNYQSGGIFSIAAKSFFQGLSAGFGALKGGSFSQIGGEFLFENGKIVWCHRMKNTRDHTEIDDLKLLLGL